jgi:hypothetical protein
MSIVLRPSSKRKRVDTILGQANRPDCYGIDRDGLSVRELVTRDGPLEVLWILEVVPESAALPEVSGDLLASANRGTRKCARSVIC